MSRGSVSVAIYARVSSERQAEAGTTASQLEALLQRLSVQQVCRRLDRLCVPTRTGKAHWNPGTVCGIIHNPAYIGRAAYGKKQLYVYYRCTGTGRHDEEGQRMCSNRALRADLLDQAVREDVRSFLCDPQRIQQEYQRRLNRMENRESWHSLDQLHSTVRKVQRGIERMIDAYADGLLTKEEFEPRIKRAKQCLAMLEQEQKDQADEQLQRSNLKLSYCSAIF